MALSTDLCTLAEVKSWLSITTTTSDTLLSGLISSISRVIYTYLNRPYLLPIQRTEVRDGVGGQKLMLREWPVQSVASLMVDGTAILPCTAPPFGAGYILEQADPYPPGQMQQLILPVQYFSRGIANVTIVYTAGYQVTGEAWTVPGTPYQLNTTGPFGDWARDVGVTYANGTALTKVTGAPAQGQYAVNATGQYTFAAADQGAAVLISYGYVPGDIKQAAIEAVAERFNYRGRIGIASKTLASMETVSYSIKDLPDFINLALQQYVRVAAP